MKRTSFSLLFAAVALAGCTVNLDRNQNGRNGNQADWQAQGWRGGGNGSPQWIAERDLNNCPMYSMPDRRVVPTAPVEEYKALSERTDEKSVRQRETLLLDHIEKLRYYIKDVNTDNTDQYMKYLMQCTGRVKQK